MQNLVRRQLFSLGEPCFLRGILKFLYYIYVSWKGNAEIIQTGRNKILLKSKGKNLSFSALFQSNSDKFGISEKSGITTKIPQIPDYPLCAKASSERWYSYWTEGGFIDLGNVKDKRATELERRIILSQYLMGAQEAGNIPPQETGLT